MEKADGVASELCDSMATFGGDGETTMQALTHSKAFKIVAPDDALTSTLEALNSALCEIQKSILAAPRGKERKKLKAVSDAIEAAAFVASESLGNQLSASKRAEEVSQAALRVEADAASLRINFALDELDQLSDSNGGSVDQTSPVVATVPPGVVNRMQQLRISPPSYVSEHIGPPPHILSPFQSRMMQKMSASTKQALAYFDTEQQR